MSGHDTRRVLDDHLARRMEGDLEGDLRANYATDVVCLSLTGVRHGWDGVRAQAAELRELLPDATYRYRKLLTEGEFGMLVWDGDGDGTKVRDGVDSFVVRDGRIVAQAVHYHVVDH